MFVNMLEKCTLGSSSMCSEERICSEITFQMDEGDPHQIKNRRGILTLAVLMLVTKRPDRKNHNQQSKVEPVSDAFVLSIKSFSFSRSCCSAILVTLKDADAQLL